MTDSRIRLEIRADLGVGFASEERQKLLDALSAPPDCGLLVEFDGPSPTQPAMQVFLAGLKQAEAQGIPIATGPIAEAIRTRCLATPDKEIAT